MTAWCSTWPKYIRGNQYLETWPRSLFLPTLKMEWVKRMKREPNKNNILFSNLNNNDPFPIPQTIMDIFNYFKHWISSNRVNESVSQWFLIYFIFISWYVTFISSATGAFTNWFHSILPYYHHHHSMGVLNDTINHIFFSHSPYFYISIGIAQKELPLHS